MQRTTLLIWSWLSILNHKRYEALVQAFGDLDEALNSLDENLLKNLGCRQDTIEKTFVRLDEFDPDAYEAELAKRGLQLLSIEDTVYPETLKTIADAPVFLYAKGDLEVLKQPCISVVGTRQMSAYGQRVVETLVPSFVQAHFVTVSGLAFGIDTVCAEETLAAGGQTVAVLGHGFAQLAPKKKVELADAIVAQGGLVLSEFALDIPADTYTFPARNRIIAGLSVGTVVVEAGAKSGALITADFALDQGREVFAVPGSVFDERCAGCHALIAKGQARLVTSAEDILLELGAAVPTGESSSYEPVSETEQKIYTALTTLPQSVSDLVEKLALETATVNATLTMLELNGAARNMGAGQWVRS